MNEPTEAEIDAAVVLRREFEMDRRDLAWAESRVCEWELRDLRRWKERLPLTKRGWAKHDAAMEQQVRQKVADTERAYRLRAAFDLKWGGL